MGIEIDDITKELIEKISRRIINKNEGRKSFCF